MSRGRRSCPCDARGNIMFRRYPSKTYILSFSIIFLISYFVIVQYRLSNRCAKLQGRYARRKEVSILERKFCASDNFIDDETLEEIRAKIDIEAPSYNWNVSGANKFQELVLEEGGTPHRTLIIAGLRSDAGFLGDIISSLPGSFYYSEPLRYLNTTQVRREPLSYKAVKILKSIFECKTYDVALNFIKEKQMGYTRNFERDLPLIWDHVGRDIRLVLDPEFLEKVCRLFPFQSVTETLVRVDVLKELMMDDKLNLHLVILIRDPRGLVERRRHDPTCIKDPECIRPEYICADMISDFHAAGDLMHRFPGRTRVIRFEELAQNPYETTKDLLHFLRLDMTDKIKEKTYQQSTTRDFKEEASNWRTLMDFKEVRDIQVSCRGAMELWGYLPAMNETHLINPSFHPLGNYKTRLRYID